jgi:hypothetical protein
VINLLAAAGDESATGIAGGVIVFVSQLSTPKQWLSDDHDDGFGECGPKHHPANNEYR